MATAGITHDLVLDGQGYMLGGGKGAYIKESSPGIAPGGAALNTGGTEALVNPNPGNALQPFNRLYWDEWRGTGRPFLRGGGAGSVKGTASEERSNAIDSTAATGGAGGLFSALNNLRPLKNGAGVGLAPAAVNYSNAGFNASYFGSIIYGGNVYAVCGTTVFKVTVDASGNFSGVTNLGTLPYTVVSCGYDAAGIAYACCSNWAAYRIDTPPYTSAAFGAAYLVPYAGIAFRSSPDNNLYWTVPGAAGQSNYAFTSPIRSLVAHEGALWIGCDDGLYRLEGALEPSNPASAPNTFNLFKPRISKVLDASPGTSPYPSSGLVNNFTSLVSFDRSLWGCLNGQLVRITAGLAGNSYTVEVQPVPGGWASSIAKAAGMLFACLQVANGNSQIWVYEPSVGGWWRLNSGADEYFLFSGGGVVKNGALMSIHYNSSSLSRWAFSSSNPAGVDSTNFGSAWPTNGGFVTLPAFTADDLAKAVGTKAGAVGMVQVLRVGVEWDTFYNSAEWYGWPGLNANPTYIGTAAFSAQVSGDGGQSFTNLANAKGVTSYLPNASNSYTGRTDWVVPAGVGVMKPVSQVGQGAPDENGQNANLLGVTINLSGPYSPLIRRVWVDFKVVELNPLSGRRWKVGLDLLNSPEGVGLDGAPDSAAAAAGEPAYSGAQLKGWRLFNLWQTGKRAAFFDLDGSGPYTVQVAAVREERSAPGGAGAALPPNYSAALELVEISEV